MKRKSGSLDFLLTLLTCAAVYLQSPLGSLIDRGLHSVFGGSSRAAPLTSFFSFEAGNGDGPSLSEIHTLGTANGGLTLEGAQERVVPLPLYRALRLASQSGGFALSTAQKDQAQKALERQGPSLATLPTDPAARNDFLAALLVKDHASRLGSLDAGAAALIVGEQTIAHAIARANARGKGQANTIATYGDYLAHDIRKPVQTFVHQLMAMVLLQEFEWPIRKDFQVTSGFGYRRHPVLAERRFHNGIDLAVPVDSPVYAAQAGKVRYAGYDRVNGYFTRIDHGYGVSTAYAHNSRLLVDTGRRVQGGDIIARSGNTGRSTGPHLHYIIKLGGTAIDPADVHPTR